MEGVITALADKQQTRLRAIGSRGMTTDGASFARVVGIHLDGHRTLRKGFISNHALQFSKRPFGVGGIGFALLSTRFLASLAFGSIANGCQVLQADHALRVLINDAFGDYMIGVLLQPSLSSAYHHQAMGSRASAFVLKTLPQSRIMISFGNHLFARIEGTISLRGGSHGKIAYPNIHPSHTRLGLWCWVCSLHFERDQQIEACLGFVIPQMSRSYFSTDLYQGNMLVIACIRHNHTPFQSQDTHLLCCLEAIVLAVLIGQRRRDILGSLIKSLISLLGDASFPLCTILFDLCPERLIGSPDLSRNAACHLGRQMKTGANLIVRSILQSNPIAHFAMLKCILTHEIERVAIGHLRCTQCSELFWSRMQFEFRREYRFHPFEYIRYSTTCQERKTVQRTTRCTSPRSKEGRAHSSPPWKDGASCAQFL